jgi:uncharacterized protein (TIGR02145 family)
MKAFNRIRNLLLVCIPVLILYACEKKTGSQSSLPTVITYPVDQIVPTSAYGGGIIMHDGGGTILAKGLCWSTSIHPTIDDNKIVDVSTGNAFWIKIPGLVPGTTNYWIRSFATNSAGTAYGEELGFSTPVVVPVTFNGSTTYGSLTDIDNNVYKTVVIGTQTWMAENLKVTKFNDGSPIVTTSDLAEWGSLTGPGYTYYDFNPEVYKQTFGALYNWYATASAKLCPTGWHVPSDSEWTILTTYLGNDGSSALKLREVGNTHWYFAPLTATNETGFTALPGSFLNMEYNTFYQVGFGGYWWSSITSADNSEQAYSMTMGRINDQFNMLQYSKKFGMSIRCVKDAGVK